ncbi:MAG: hypothetical protein K6T29_02295 [Peptococcaceae bacterium]|nr:hypothetical protein [Peptococcaceae bacterium]
MAGSGEKMITLHDFVAACVGMLAIAGVILLGGGLGFLLGLPYAVTGLLAGVIAAWVILTGSFAGTLNVKCPECGNRDKVVGTVGSYQCSSCGRVVTIPGREPQEITLYSPFPTD